MKTYKGLDVFEKGKGKICISLMGEDKTQIFNNLVDILEKPVDVIEWRADLFNDLLDVCKCISIVNELKQLLIDKPLLFTIRTKNEGGNAQISKDEYKELILSICEQTDVDMIDVEYMMGESVYEPIIDCAHRHNIAVIGSNHNFEMTPDAAYIYNMLSAMYEAGMDVSKMAVMAKDKSDTARLLYATSLINEKKPYIYTITMSMGELGTISRIVGYKFDSVMTFGACKVESAPGQIEAKKLRMMMDSIDILK